MAGRPMCLLVAALLLPMGLAGCSSSDTGSAEAQGGPTGILDAADSGGRRSTSLGSLEGTVIDDELRPLPGASATLVELDLSTETGANGTFAFLNIEPGTFSLLIERRGYEPSASSVTVEARATTEVEIALRTIVVRVPHLENFNHNLRYGVQVSFVSAAVTQFAGGIGNELTCEACRWDLTTSNVPDGLVYEVFGQHTVSAVLASDQELVYLYDKIAYEANPGPGAIVAWDLYTLPVWFAVGREPLMGLTEFFVEHNCDSYWFCIEERREIWATAFYNQEVPEGYTARPE